MEKTSKTDMGTMDLWGAEPLRGGGRAGVLKNRKQKTRGGPGARDPTGSRKYAQGGPRRRRGEAASGESRKDGA